MQCPICNVDLSELDLVSRHEHVELCVENGPSMLVATETGQLVVQSKLPPAKQRKICPICSKTFQSLHTHFKTCALKNDLPPHLMLEYWDKINLELDCTRKFPKELLDKYIVKSIKEGRVGEQVDFARALLLSMVDSEPQSVNGGYSTAQVTQVSSIISESSNDATGDITTNVTSASLNASTLLIQNAQQPQTSAPTRIRQQQKSKPKYRIELVDDVTKEANIQLRIDRELAATRMKRYEEALVAQASKRAVGLVSVNEHDDDCIVLDDQQSQTEIPETAVTSQFVTVTNDSNADFKTLFHKAKLKKCNNSTYCLMGECKQDHNIRLIIDGFDRFTLPLQLNKSDKSPEKSNQYRLIDTISPNCSQQAPSATSCDTIKEEDEEDRTSGIELEAPSASSSEACSQ